MDVHDRTHRLQPAPRSRLSPLPLGILLLLTALSVAPPTRAWSPEGHFLIAAVADRLIAGTPAAREVAAILDGGTLESIATWSDCVRGVQREGGSFRYVVNERYADCRPYETEDGQRAMVRYVERNWTQCSPGPTDAVCHDQYHYVNLPVQRRTYARGITGTSNHDVVGAVGAAAMVLRGRPAPPPFSLDRGEALRVLVHSLGDLHQPLHVASLYLDASGRRIDPDRRRTGPANHTLGANRLVVGTRNLHSMWDGVPDSLRRDAFLTTAVDAARRVRRTSGAAARWPALWATETLLAGQRGLDKVTAGARSARGEWPVTLPDGEAARREAIQRQQLIRAGARLAQLLQDIYPR